MQVKATGPHQCRPHIYTRMSQTLQGQALFLRTKPQIFKRPRMNGALRHLLPRGTRENTSFLESDRPGFASQMGWPVVSERSSRAWSLLRPRLAPITPPTADLTPGTPGPLFLLWAAYPVAKRTDSEARLRSSNLTSSLLTSCVTAGDLTPSLCLNCSPVN